MIVVAALIIIGRVSRKSDISVLYGEAKKGQFDIIVYTTGELQAENSLDIRGLKLHRQEISGRWK